MQKILSIFLVLLLAACSSTTQTTSGRSYLDRHYVSSSNKQDGAKTEGFSLEEAILKAAAVEPALKFPARIGIARIKNRGLGAISGEEVAQWKELQAKLGASFGEFIPVNPITADIASAQAQIDAKSQIDPISKIRLGAARQHLDAVFIYEVYNDENSEANLLSIANITIIGAYILPSNRVNVKSYANGILIDVIQGYPYGTAEAFVEKDSLTSRNFKSEKRRNLRSEGEVEAVHKLAIEAEEMFKNLRGELANK
ncbi:MAG: hypothetical protein R3E13_01405 [Alphaproteobacteria bacterium]